MKRSFVMDASKDFAFKSGSCSECKTRFSRKEFFDLHKCNSPRLCLNKGDLVRVKSMSSRYFNSNAVFKSYAVEGGVLKAYLSVNSGRGVTKIKVADLEVLDL